MNTCRSRKCSNSTTLLYCDRCCVGRRGKRYRIENNRLAAYLEFKSTGAKEGEFIWGICDYCGEVIPVHYVFYQQRKGRVTCSPLTDSDCSRKIKSESVASSWAEKREKTAIKDDLLNTLWNDTKPRPEHVHTYCKQGLDRCATFSECHGHKYTGNCFKRPSRRTAWSAIDIGI